MKKGLKPTTIKAHKRIITNFSFNSKILFIIVGFKHIKYMEKLQIDFIIFDNIKALNLLLNGKLPYIKKYTIIQQLHSKESYFITKNDNRFIKALQVYKKEKLFKKIALIDLEVLKYTELISTSELKYNEVTLGLELAQHFTLKDYIKELKKEGRNKPHKVYKYLQITLNNEILRQKQINKKGLKQC